MGDILPGGAGGAGGGTVAALGDAVINNGGSVIWQTTLLSGRTDIYLGSVGGATKVVASGDDWTIGVDDFPEDLKELQSVSQPRVNDNSKVGFKTTLPGPYGDGYFVANPDGGGGYTYVMHVLLVEPTPVASSYSAVAPIGPHSFESAGQSVLLTESGGTEIVMQYALFWPIVVEGEPAPGTGGNFESFLAKAVGENSPMAMTGMGNGISGVWTLPNAILCKDTDGDGIGNCYEGGPVDLDRDGTPEIDLSDPLTPGEPADPDGLDIFIEVD